MKSPRPVRTQQGDRPISTTERGTPDRGIELVCDLLKYHREPSGWYRTITYRNVERDRVFQPLGVDILWCVAASTCACFVTLEVKTDLNDSADNFFFETVGNVAKGTRGTFVSSMAEWYLYAFPSRGRVFCLPLFDTKSWFLARQEEFASREVRTGQNGRRRSALGRIVPVERVVSEVPGVKVFQQRGERWLNGSSWRKS